MSRQAAVESRFSEFRRLERAPTLAEQTVAQLTQLFAREGWKPGDRLPSEPELGRMLGIGRSTLRESLKTLSFLGVIRVRAGEGTFLAEPAPPALARVATSGLFRVERSLSALCETRLVLETALVAFAAKRALPEDLDRLAELNRSMQKGAKLPTPEFVDLDISFHLALAQAAKSEVLAELLSKIRGLLQDWVIKSQRLTEARELANSGHPAILKAVAARRPSEARRAMTEHLEASFKLLLQASREKDGQD